MHQLIRTTNTKRVRTDLTRAQQRQVENEMEKIWDSYFLKERPSYEQAAAKLTQSCAFKVTTHHVRESVTAIGKTWPRESNNPSLGFRKTDTIFANAIMELYQSLGQLAPPELLALSNFPMPSDEQD